MYPRSGLWYTGKFQRELHNYKIVVYIYVTKATDVMFKGDNNGKTINLLYHQRHYNVITSLTLAFCALKNVMYHTATQKIIDAEVPVLAVNISRMHRVGESCLR